MASTPSQVPSPAGYRGIFRTGTGMLANRVPNPPRPPAITPGSLASQFAAGTAALSNQKPPRVQQPGPKGPPGGSNSATQTPAQQVGGSSPTWVGIV